MKEDVLNHPSVLAAKADTIKNLQLKQPVMDPDKAHEYLNWLALNAAILNTVGLLETHLKLGELLVRIGGNAAQAKATQHTLVEDGIIAPPVAAS